EDHREDGHREQWLQDRPRRAQDRLLVAQLETAEDEKVEQLVRAGELAQIERRPALRRADGDHGRRGGLRHVVKIIRPLCASYRHHPQPGYQKSRQPLVRRPAGGHATSRGRLIDMAEMNSDENNVLHPMMTSVAANDTHSGCGRGSRSERSHSATTATRIATPRTR